MVKRFNPEFRVGQGGILEVSADRSLPGDAFLVLVDATAGPVIITLQRADGFGGKRFCIKKVDSSVNVVTIVPIVGQTIDGQASIELSNPNAAIEVISDNENYDSVGYPGGSISFQKVRMRRAAVQSIILNVDTTFLFDTEDYDIGDIGDITTGEITIKQAGIYLINAGWLNTFIQNQVLTGIKINGVSTVSGGDSKSTSGGTDFSNVTGILQLSVGDVITIFGRVGQNTQNTSVALVGQPFVEVNSFIQ